MNSENKKKSQFSMNSDNKIDNEYSLNSDGLLIMNEIINDE